MINQLLAIEMYVHQDFCKFSFISEAKTLSIGSFNLMINLSYMYKYMKIISSVLTRK